MVSVRNSEITFTFGSLFSGIGGFDLGLERAGMTCAWQVEIDPYCQKVLEKHWSGVPRYEDVRKVGKHNLEPVDLIAGGFPCQPHSLAGKRRASKDERDLWKEFYRIICELKPKWVLAENVPGLLSSEAGRFFGGILRDLSVCGYDAEWQVLPAAAFGAPHIRERVFVVAYRESSRGGGLPIFSNEGSYKNASNAEYHEILHNRQQFFMPNPDTLRSDWWKVEPGVGRVADGIPSRVDRLRGLGNAVVPQVAEWIGRKIMEATHEMRPL